MLRKEHEVLEELLRYGQFSLFLPACFITNYSLGMSVVCTFLHMLYRLTIHR